MVPASNKVTETKPFLFGLLLAFCFVSIGGKPITSDIRTFVSLPQHGDNDLLCHLNELGTILIETYNNVTQEQNRGFEMEALISTTKKCVCERKNHIRVYRVIWEITGSCTKSSCGPKDAYFFDGPDGPTLKNVLQKFTNNVGDHQDIPATSFAIARSMWMTDEREVMSPKGDKGDDNKTGRMMKSDHGEQITQKERKHQNFVTLYDYCPNHVWKECRLSGNVI